MIPAMRSARRTTGPAYQVTERRPDGFSFKRDGASTKILLDGQMMRWATAEWVSQKFLDSLSASRNLERKAPRGDSHAGWQKVAEVPYNWLASKIGDLQDEKAIARLLNDSDYRRLRTDGNHRRL